MFQNTGIKGLIGLCLALVTLSMWTYSWVSYKYPGKKIADIAFVDAPTVSPQGQMKIRQIKRISGPECVSLALTKPISIRVRYQTNGWGEHKKNRYQLVIKPPTEEELAFDLSIRSRKKKEDDSFLSDLLGRVFGFGGVIRPITSFEEPESGEWCFTLKNQKIEITEEYLLLEIHEPTLRYSREAFFAGCLGAVLIIIFFRRKKVESGGVAND